MMINIIPVKNKEVFLLGILATMVMLIEGQFFLSKPKLSIDRQGLFEQFSRDNFRAEKGSVSIKNQKKLWGSCSAKRNLNFNYKIALIPKEFSRYIVVHEVCHLVHLNHSQKFWDLASSTKIAQSSKVWPRKNEVVWNSISPSSFKSKSSIVWFVFRTSASCFISGFIFRSV